ncbi:MAG: hypothetical protein UH103_07675, partial [Paludibacteraceae bacterium]|nr:hypothetical protein [Paludibacteraceae bacterium]
MIKKVVYSILFVALVAFLLWIMLTYDINSVSDHSEEPRIILRENNHIMRTNTNSPQDKYGNISLRNSSINRNITIKQTPQPTFIKPQNDGTGSYIANNGYGSTPSSSPSVMGGVASSVYRPLPSTTTSQSIIALSTPRPQSLSINGHNHRGASSHQHDHAVIETGDRWAAVVSTDECEEGHKNVEYTADGHIICTHCGAIAYWPEGDDAINPDASVDWDKVVWMPLGDVVLPMLLMALAYIA